MPIGNGDLAANIWVAGSKLHILLSKSDAWSEEGRLLKLGKISLTFRPSIFSGNSFRQRLRVKDATIIINGEEEASIVIWIHALTNVLILEISSPHLAVEVTVDLVIWRDKVRSVLPGEETSMMGATCRPRVLYPDTAVPADGEGNLVWYHRNENRSIFSEGLLHEGLDPSFVAGLPDPLLNRTFGALLRGRTLTDGAEARFAATYLLPEPTDG